MGIGKAEIQQKFAKSTTSRVKIQLKHKHNPTLSRDTIEQNIMLYRLSIMLSNHYSLAKW